MKKILAAIFLASGICLTTGCSGSGSSDYVSQSPTSAPVTAPATAVQGRYSTYITRVALVAVSASVGGVLQDSSANSKLSGVTLTIPKNALSENKNLSLGIVDNAPALPGGCTVVGLVMDFGPDGTVFSATAKPTLKISFTENDLRQAGVTSKVDLKLYAYDKATHVWSQVDITSIDSDNDIVMAQISHFSFYALVGLSGTTPSDLGRPQPGDALYHLSSYDFGLTYGWIPGHVGIYVGELDWDGKDVEHVSFDVIHFGKYNVIEALPGVGVIKSYYKVPGAYQSRAVQTLFAEGGYMGAREPRDFTLTSAQRAKIVELAEKQVGKPYAMSDTVVGFLDGTFVKGPDKFNCVGAYESDLEGAGANGGQGLVLDDDWRLLTPAEQYSNTRPSGGADVGPMINWATITPNSGTPATNVLVQISVSHPYGLDFIDKVSYITDDGYVNPSININDSGADGDLKAGDGIYSVSALAGGDHSQTTLGLNFTVTDRNGKTASRRIVFTYVNSGATYTETSARKIPSGRKTWAR